MSVTKSAQDPGPLSWIFHDIQTKMLNFQVLGILWMKKSRKVIRWQPIFTRIVLIVGKFWPVAIKICYCHTVGCFFFFLNFLGILYCVILWGFSFLLNSFVVVEKNVLHFSRVFLCQFSINWQTEKSGSTEQHFTHFPRFRNPLTLKLSIDISEFWSAFLCYSDTNLKQLHCLKPNCMSKIERPLFI